MEPGELESDHLFQKPLVATPARREEMAAPAAAIWLWRSCAWRRRTVFRRTAPAAELAAHLIASGNLTDMQAAPVQPSLTVPRKPAALSVELYFERSHSHSTTRLRFSIFPPNPMQIHPQTPANTHVAIIIWLAITVATPIALARTAVWLQVAGFGAVGALSIIFGAILGSALGTLVAYLNLRARGLITCGVILSALTMAAAEHAFFYLEYRSQYETKLQSDPMAQLARNLAPDELSPATFAKFMAAEAPAKKPSAAKKKPAKAP